MIKLTRHMAPLERITSRENQRLAVARKVRDGYDKTRVFIEGTRLVKEALRSGLAIEHCFVSDKFTGIGKIEGLSELATPVADRLFPSITDTPNPQGIVVIAERTVWNLREIGERIGAISPVVLYLTEINNPQNLGAIIRTAEAAEVAGVIVSPGSADPFSPKALRASMGSAFRLPIVTDIDRARARDWARASGLTTTAADTAATNPYFEIDWKIPRLLIFGSEAHGLRGADISAMNEGVLIPMNGEVESLNLAVSAGIILFEARRQLRN